MHGDTKTKHGKNGVKVMRETVEPVWRSDIRELRELAEEIVERTRELEEELPRRLDSCERAAGVEIEQAARDLAHPVARRLFGGRTAKYEG